MRNGLDTVCNGFESHRPAIEANFLGTFFWPVIKGLAVFQDGVGCCRMVSASRSAFRPVDVTFPQLFSWCLLFVFLFLTARHPPPPCLRRPDPHSSIHAPPNRCPAGEARVEGPEEKAAGGHRGRQPQPGEGVPAHHRGHRGGAGEEEAEEAGPGLRQAHSLPPGRRYGMVWKSFRLFDAEGIRSRPDSGELAMGWGEVRGPF